MRLLLSIATCATLFVTFIDGVLGQSVASRWTFWIITGLCLWTWIY